MNFKYGSKRKIFSVVENTARQYKEVFVSFKFRFNCCRKEVDLLNCGSRQGNVSLNGFQIATNFLVNSDGECNDVPLPNICILADKTLFGSFETFL